MHSPLLPPPPHRVIGNHQRPLLMWKQKHCQAPDRRRNKANRPQSRLNGGLAAWLTETSPTACSSLTPAGRLRDGGGFWLIKQISCFITGMKVAIHKLWSCPFLSRAVLARIQSNRETMLCLTEAGGSTVHCVVSKKRWVSQPSRGLTLQPAVTADKWPKCGGFCLDRGLQLDQKPIFCPSNLCKPHPHSTTVLSHRAEWLQPLWLASICIHSYSTPYLPLISHPPLHFSKLRCNFVSLQWDHPSALPVDCHLVSYSCRACSLLVLQWMTIQGHICTTFRYLCLDSFASCWCYPRSLHACEKQKESQYTSPHMESANSQLDDATADRHIDI